MAAGTALGWSSPAGPELKKGLDPHYNFTVTDEDLSWIGSAMNLGKSEKKNKRKFSTKKIPSFPGAASICIPIGFLINMLGRKLSMLLLVIPFTIGWGCMIFAPNLATMIVGRVFLGLSGGAFCVTAPMFIGEIAQKEIRGTLGSFFQASKFETSQSKPL